MSDDAIDRDFAAHVERIRGFLRIPSVSAADGDLRPTAAAVCELVELAGGHAEVREPEEPRPTVIGVIDGPPPTVLRYGMYDVQPPGAGWTVDPFAAELRDGRILARGAANSKAALACALLAFASKPSPCRQVLVYDGEEELGSPRLGAFVEAHSDELEADYALDFDLMDEPSGPPPIFAGVRGLHEIELHAGGIPDVHSSLVASVPQPAIELARAIVALKQAVPVANVAWILAGTPEDVSRTVVPGTARAGVDIRYADELGKGSDPFPNSGDELLEQARAAMPEEVELVLKGTYPPATAPVDGAPVRAMAAAMERQGRTPEVHAQSPWWAPYHIFGVPFAAGGLGRAGGAHGPDEWCEVEGLRALMHLVHDTVTGLATHHAAPHPGAPEGGRP